MIEAPMPANESARLNSLRKTKILDTPLEERFERITRLVCRLLGVPTASISLVDDTRQWFKSMQGSNLTETPRGIAFCSHAVLNDEIMVVRDAKTDARFHDNPLVTGDENVQFYAGHPLKTADGHRIGVLCAIDHKPRDLSDEDLQTLRDLAALAEVELNASTMAETQKELLTELDAERRRALIDPLTRLWNREGIMAILAREHARAMRHHEHLGILIADVDYFKRVNDTYGHPTGDAVLKEVAKRLLSVVRETDAVGRIGGEEFLVVVPTIPGTGNVNALAAHACSRVAETQVATNAGTLSLTVSIGGVEETIDFASNIDDLIVKADNALYRAKQMGRNRTHMFEPRTIEQMAGNAG